MLSLSELVRIYVCLAPTDMRKSFDSLAALVQEWLGPSALGMIFHLLQPYARLAKRPR